MWPEYRGGHISGVEIRVLQTVAAANRFTSCSDTVLIATTFETRGCSVK